MGFETRNAGKNGLWEIKDVPVEPFHNVIMPLSMPWAVTRPAKMRDELPHWIHARPKWPPTRWFWWRNGMKG